MFKKIIVFLTSLLLILNSTFTNAATIGAWTVSNPMAVGASILYDGSKGAVTSSVLITPNASQVAKVLRGGLAGYALSFAVEQLLGAVDWVLDPANNQITYKVPPTDPSNFPYLWCNTGIGCYTTPAAAGAGFLLYDNRLYPSYNSIRHEEKVNGTTLTVYVYNSSNQLKNLATFGYTANQNYNPNQERTLPLETVAQKVIENAESDNLDAQFAVLAAANNILSEAEQDDAKAKPIEDELENNAKCPSGIVRNGSCWICDKSQFMPITRATRDAKTATRGKSCKNVTDTAIKTANATLFRNLINARIQENACWSPPDPNHATALIDAQNALSLCEN